MRRRSERHAVLSKMSEAKINPKSDASSNLPDIRPESVKQEHAALWKEAEEVTKQANELLASGVAENKLKAARLMTEMALKLAKLIQAMKDENNDLLASRAVGNN